MIICRECEKSIDDFVILTDGIDEYYYCPDCVHIGIAEGLKEK